jgi:hypothetical protein
MSNPTNRFLLACITLSIAICLCLSLVCLVGAGLMLVAPAQPTPLTYLPTPTASLRPLATPSPLTPIAGLTPAAPSATPSAAGQSDLRLRTATPTVPATPGNLSAVVLSQMEAIQQQVSLLSGLQPSGDFSRTLLSPAQLRQKVLDDFFADYTAAEALEDALTLNALGLLPAGFDLRGFYVELYSEQVAGYYDNEAKAMYILQGAGFQGPERLTYAHEYVHALQDQTYDIQNGLQYNDETCETDSERCAAVQALLEGDASRIEMQWLLQYSTTQDRRDIAKFYSTFSSPVYDSAPAYMQSDFIFPYEQGKAFVDYLFNHGGQAAVAAAYANPPVSTEQILHPERYPGDLPIAVALPDLLGALGAGWETLDQGVLGEWYTYLALAQGDQPAGQVGDSQAKAAAAGWEGDAYAVYHHAASGASALVLISLWESPAEAGQFQAAFKQHAAGRFGAPQADQAGLTTWETVELFTALHVEGARTVWIAAPDAATAQALWQAVPEP